MTTYDESTQWVDRYSTTLNTQATATGTTIDTNAKDSDKEPAVRVQHLTQKVKSMQTETQKLHHTVVNIQTMAVEFQQSSLDRISTFMTEFLDFANKAKRILDNINHLNNTHSSKYIIHPSQKSRNMI